MVGAGAVMMVCVYTRYSDSLMVITIYVNLIVPHNTTFHSHSFHF